MKKRSQLAFIISAIISTQSYAGLEIYSSSVVAGDRNATYSFNQSGVSGEASDKVQGYGKDMPLGLALQIIVPKTWHVNLNSGSEEMLVNWEGKTSWQYVLENLAKQNNLNINVDWTSKVVDVYSISAAKSRRLARNEGNGSRLSSLRNQIGADGASDLSIEEIYNNSNVRPIDGKVRTFVSSVYNSSVTEETQAKFILVPGTMLSENLKMWGEYTGWDVKWRSGVDYKVTNEVSFNGNLKRVIENSLKLYSEGEQPLKAEFYDGNKVVEIKEFIFKDAKIKIEQ